METLRELQAVLADKQAVGVILELPVVVIEGRVWRNTTDQRCEWEVKYLRLRNRLMHNHEQPWLVQVLGDKA